MNKEIQSILEVANGLTKRFIEKKDTPEDIANELEGYISQTRGDDLTIIREACNALNRTMLVLGQAKAGNMYEAVISDLL